MDERIITFGDIELFGEIEFKFHHRKNLIFLEDLDVLI